jgi:hypothetical protein
MDIGPYTADDLDVIRRVAAGCEERPLPGPVPRQIEIAVSSDGVAPEPAGWSCPSEQAASPHSRDGHDHWEPADPEC